MPAVSLMTLSGKLLEKKNDLIFNSKASGAGNFHAVLVI